MDNIQLIILLVVAAIVVWFFFFRNSSDINTFSSKLPKERYPELVTEFGEPDDHAKGLIMWYNKKGLYNRIVLKDEEIPHCKPAPHHDFLYSTIQVYLPRDVVCEVIKISKSIYYDQLKRELTVRCHFTGANIATIYIVLMVASGLLTIDDINSQDLYKKTIMATMDNKEYRDNLENDIRQMQASLNATAPKPDTC